MKLLICRKCKAVFNLVPNKIKICDCGESRGSYVDDLNAIYEGPAVPLGIDNFSLRDAYRKPSISKKGKRFDAFIIPDNCETFVKK